MKIIRQDKKGHYDYGDIRIEECIEPNGAKKFYRILKLTSNTFYDMTLGNYSNEEKALKVMDMIKETVNNNKRIELSYLGSNYFEYVDEYIGDIQFHEYFEMPLDEEVEV